MEDIVRLHERALDEAARLVDGVTPAQMGLPTPCSEWDVRALLTHLVGGNLRWVSVAQGRPLQRPPAQGARPSPELLGDDPATAYRRSAAALTEAWQDPSLLHQQFDIPFGIMPGRAALTLHVVETVTHGWDLAKQQGRARRSIPMSCGRRPLHPGDVAALTPARQSLRRGGPGGGRCT